MNRRVSALAAIVSLIATLTIVGDRVQSQQVSPPRQGQAPKSRILQSTHKPAAPVGEFKIAPQPGAKPPTIEEMNKSMKTRRDNAWNIISHVWEPVVVQGGTIPLWMTWYEEEDITELYKSMVAKDMGGNGKPPTRIELRANVAAVLKQHSNKDLNSSLSSARLGKALRQFTLPQFHDLGPNRKPGTGSIYYNPAYVRHLLANAANIAGCDPAAPPRPADRNNLFAQCLDSEMPADAVMIKVEWAKWNEEYNELQTGAPFIANGIKAAPTGNWIKYPPQPTVFCCGPYMFTISDENGDTWGLLGMHIAMKQSRTWTWISIFDMGTWDWNADAPQALLTQWPLGEYGMCTVTDFLEGDPAPWSAYDGKGNQFFQRLPNAIKSVYGVMNGSQWCANPYIEPDMSRGNCLGCHQGSPTSVLPLTITKDRQTNPSDFGFSFDTNRANIIQIRKAYALTHKLQQKP